MKELSRSMGHNEKTETYELWAQKKEKNSVKAIEKYFQ